MSFFKTFFKGLAYVICSPFIVLVYALFAVYSVGLFLVEWVIAIIKFFTGDKMSIFTAEDQVVLDLVNAQNNTAVNQQSQPVMNNTQNNTTNNSTQQTIVNNYFVGKDVNTADILKGQIPNTTNPQAIDNQNNNPLDYHAPKAIENNAEPQQIEQKQPDIVDVPSEDNKEVK